MVIHGVSSVAPRCTVFGTCGGCLYQDISYRDELKIKENLILGLLQNLPNWDTSVMQSIVASPQEYYYRHRLDLKLLRTKAQEIFIGFSPIGRGKVVPVHECPIAMPAVSEFIPKLIKLAEEKLTPKYRQANLVVRTGDDDRVFWGGIGKKSLQLPEKNYLWTLVEGRKIFYSLDTFFQANLSILPLLFEKIKQLNIWNKKTVFYDLYGGVGLFGLGLYDVVKNVVLIELNPASVQLAKYNVEYHDLKDFNIIEGPVENHLMELLSTTVDHQQVVMIDPPRAGLSDEARAFLIKAHLMDSLLYLSCHPESLAKDLTDFINAGWSVEVVIPFDFFPKTKHVETLVYLTSPQ